MCGTLLCRSAKKEKNRDPSFQAEAAMCDGVVDLLGRAKRSSREEMIERARQ